MECLETSAETDATSSGRKPTHTKAYSKLQAASLQIGGTEHGVESRRLNAVSEVSDLLKCVCGTLVTLSKSKLGK